jgi:N-carbamoyl-L-amino-acid hydrolase
MLDALAQVGLDAGTGGYRRFAWTDADMELREWFVGEAEARGMDVVEDGNGNQLAWTKSGPDALLLGSHLDSVPDGGAFDGPLGVVSAFAALDRIPEPERPIVVANFADEEGARFGIACAGSQLATGVLAPEKALALKDRDGLTMAEVLTARGRDPHALGRADWLNDIGTFVELHVEQGRHLVHTGDAVGVATAIWPHGRWRLDFTGVADHAGATRMTDRRDPMLAYAATALAARRLATDADSSAAHGPASQPGARATFGRLEVAPGGTNAIPSRVRAWLDARAGTEDELERLVDGIVAEARQAATADATEVELVEESVSPAVTFDVPLRDRLATLLDAPVLPTGAGHDAGVLSPLVPTAMLFVRNPTGVSHSPAEHADDADCAAGVDAMVRVIETLAS